MSQPERVLSLKEIYPEYDIGEGSYGDLKVFGFRHAKDGPTLSVGAYSSFALDCRVVLGGDHRTDWVTTYPFAAVWGLEERFPGHPKSKGDVHIGSDVWVGASALILSGVTIGDGAVIGAGSVVTKDIPAYAVAYGNPARPERSRFEPKHVAVLLAIRWWEWPRPRIEAALRKLLDTDVDAFIRWARDRAPGDSE